MRYFSTHRTERTALKKCNSYSYSGEKHYINKEGEHRRFSTHSSTGSTKTNKRKLLYRVSSTFIPNCVLSPNRNPLEELYRLFPQLPPGEKPLNGFTCALHKDILLQGRMVVCSNCICFHSNIFGYETRVIIYFKNVLAIRREKTAFVVPNAISVRTLHKRYFFCSFLSRESVYKLLSRIWKTSTVNTEGLDNEPDGVGNTVSRNFKDMACDFNRHKLLFTSSSSSYESSLGASSYSRMIDYPGRPHTSPPSLNNIFTALAASRKYDDDDQTGYVSTESNSEREEDDEVNIDKLTIIKANSIGDLCELDNIQTQLGAKKLEKIGREMLQRHEQYIQQRNANRPVAKLLRCIKLVSSEGLRYPAFWILSFLIFILAGISFSLLLRINEFSSYNQHNNTPDTSNIKEYSKLKEIFEIRDGLHSAKVERLKSILSTNLETVNEVNKALREIQKKLQI